MPLDLPAVVSSVEAIHDKASGTSIVRATRLAAQDRRPRPTVRTGRVIRGEGGFEGDPHPALEWLLPDRSADHRIELTTRPDQGLLYRLSGDRNPLHSEFQIDEGALFQAGFSGGGAEHRNLGQRRIAALADLVGNRIILDAAKAMTG